MRKHFAEQRSEAWCEDCVIEHESHREFVDKLTLLGSIFPVKLKQNYQFTFMFPCVIMLGRLNPWMKKQSRYSAYLRFCTSVRHGVMSFELL
ncbi:hypothetical protein TNCT_310861 [Trichonephila clavata]|uniref:Uncharacterized protein n=1 Tax=Trichonephila clavata TaxID=2740835 RepID=A0A8X6L375_TRICU|nr:hypothetical protein TNCT_310861 [Trichonephila clavata]